MRTIVGCDGRKVVLCHYPLREWEGYHAGDLHFHGHTHDRLPSRGRSWDCGVAGVAGCRVDADADAAEFALREGPGDLHRMFEPVDAGGDAFDEMPARLSQPDAAPVALEQANAKVFLQRLDALADTGGADTEKVAAWRKFRYSATGKV